MRHLDRRQAIALGVLAIASVPLWALWGFGPRDLSVSTSAWEIFVPLGLHLALLLAVFVTVRQKVVPPVLGTAALVILVGVLVVEARLAHMFLWHSSMLYG